MSSGVEKDTASAEVQLANAELEQFRLLVTSVRDYAIFVLDPSGYIRTWNAGAENIKGYTAEDAIGRHFEMFYTEDARARDHPAYELDVATREGRYEEEGWRVRKDGTTFWANVVITALRDEDGSLVGFAKVTRDLSERRRAEQLLAESERHARDEADRQRRLSEALDQVNRAIAAKLDLDVILQTAVDAAIELTGSSVGTFDPAYDGEEVVRCEDVTADPRLASEMRHFNLPPEELAIRSYLAIPLTTVDGDSAGALFFGHPEPDRFDAAAEAAARSIATTTAIAIANAELLESAEREMAAREAALVQRDNVARALQQSLLPPDLPTIPGVAAGARYHAGHELVGGDFYDVFSLGDHCWGVVLGDVLGSGPEAASQTALTRHSVRTAAMFDPDPVSVLHALNEALLRSQTSRFTTAAFARLKLHDGGERVAVTIASGGHPPPLIWRADGSFEESPARGMLLGIDDFPLDALKVAEHELRQGDTLVLYTDGLTEARHEGVLFDVEGVQATLSDASALAPGALANRLVEAALRHASSPVSDDIAVVILRVLGREPSA